MADNTVLPTSGAGESIRTLDKTGTGTPKTEVLALDAVGGSGRGENILTFPLSASHDFPLDDDAVPVVSLSPPTLDALEILNVAKTTGSRGIHIYAPIVRGPTQKQVWTFAKEFAQSIARLHPKLITAEYRIAKRPKGHVLVDYNQNAWGRTLASVYSVRPKPHAPVSTPVTWKEIERGIEIEDFRLDNVPARVRKIGDLWKPLLQHKGRLKLEKYL